MPDAELAATAADAEAVILARELGRAYARMRDWYRDRRGLSPEAADAEARGQDDEDWLRRQVDAPADQVSWWGLSALAERRPELVAAVWRRLCTEALDELASGHRAATAIGWDGDPWGRARFLALREGFRREWGPRGGIEDALIDAMALGFAQYLFWTEQAHVRAVTEASLEDHQRKERGAWSPPRLDQAAALEQAAQMADRHHRGFLRTVRALRDLRRYPLTVRHVGQLNVGGKQVNVAGAGE